MKKPVRFKFYFRCFESFSNENGIILVIEMVYTHENLYFDSERN